VQGGTGVKGMLTKHKIIEHRVTAPTTNTLAIICLGLSLLGILVTPFIPILTHIAAIICGHIARSQISRSGESETGSGMALAGLIISYFCLVLYIIGILLLGFGLMTLFLVQ